MTVSFDLTFDYRCPWARKVHLHVLAGLRAGGDWNVRMRPFALGQSSVDENGGRSLWEDPSKLPDIHLLLAGIVVRDRYANEFLPFHERAFNARHVDILDVRDPQVVRTILTESKVDADAVLKEIDAGWPAELLKQEHRDAADRLGVFGVPTFITPDDAVFVRLLDAPTPGEDAPSVKIVNRILDQFMGWPELNEFKHPRVPF